MNCGVVELPGRASALLICGIGVVKSRGITCRSLSLSSPVAVGRVGAVSRSRLGRQPDRVAAAGPGIRRRPGASSPGFGEDRAAGSAATHDLPSVSAWVRGSPGCVGRPCFSGCSAPRKGPATRWRWGVSTGAAARSWSAVRREDRQQQGCWSWPRVHRRVGAERAPRGPGTQAAGARTWSSRLRRVWWHRRASLRAIDSNASWPSRRDLTCWKLA